MGGFGGLFVDLRGGGYLGIGIGGFGGEEVFWGGVDGRVEKTFGSLARIAIFL